MFNVSAENVAFINILTTMCEYDHKITINNYENGSSLTYSVVLLKGEVSLKCDINLINFELKSNNNVYQSQTIVSDNKFKHLIQLNLGINVITVRYCSTVIKINLHFKPLDIKCCVVPIYIVCKNHDGKFDSPNITDNSIDTACKKISIGTKLIQTIFAEKFYENGLSRKTFQFESDLFPNVPKCRVFYSNLDVKSVRNMKQDELWYAFGRELMSSEYANVNYKYLAFISCTRYRGDKYNDSITTHDEIVRLTEAHAALGGGGLAIFGSACLHTWPTSVGEVVNCFENETQVDRKQLMDDSCYRGTYGGCFATTLGSVCHELCHTFDLGHTDDGIMGRGFDEINKEFTTMISKVRKVLNVEKQHCVVDFTPNINVKITQNILPSIKRLNPHPLNYSKFSLNQNKKCINSKNGIYWTRSCLVLLFYHRWFNNTNNSSQSLEYKNMIVSSSAGICVIEIRNESSELVLEWWDFCDKPVKSFEISKDIINKFNNQSVILIAEDIAGNIIKQTL